MNKQVLLSKKFRSLITSKSDIESILSDQEIILDNFPENLQASERYDRQSDAVDHLTDAVDRMDDIIYALDETVSKIQSVVDA